MESLAACDAFRAQSSFEGALTGSAMEEPCSEGGRRCTIGAVADPAIHPRATAPMARRRDAMGGPEGRSWENQLPLNPVKTW